MNDPVDLRSALNGLAAMPPQEAGAATRDRLLTAFRARRRKSRRIRAYLGTGAAACLALALGWLLARHSASPFEPTSATVDAGYHRALTGFVPLPYAQSDVPLEEAVIVRVKLAPPAIGMFGIPNGIANANGDVHADLLVGQDGVARAVRFVE